MAREPKRFVFQLTEAEAGELAEPAGEGGHQAYQKQLVDHLLEGNLSISFDDAELGRLIRYMTQYKSGGFQGRLRSAFIRSLKEQLGIEDSLFSTPPAAGKS